MLDLFKSYPGRVLVSILWGLGLAALFRQVCKGNECIVLAAPDPHVVQESTYTQDDRCYRYETKETDCDAASEIIQPK